MELLKSIAFFSHFISMKVKVEGFMGSVFLPGICLCYLFSAKGTIKFQNKSVNSFNSIMRTKLANVTFSKHFLWMTFQKFRPYSKRNYGS